MILYWPSNWRNLCADVDCYISMGWPETCCGLWYTESGTGSEERHLLLWQKEGENWEQPQRAHSPKPQETFPQSHPSATDAFSISGVLIPWSSSSTICSWAVQKSRLASVIQLFLLCVCHLHTRTHLLAQKRKIKSGTWRACSPDISRLERWWSQWEDGSVQLFPKSYEGCGSSAELEHGEGECWEKDDEGTAGLTTSFLVLTEGGVPWKTQSPFKDFFLMYCSL